MQTKHDLILVLDFGGQYNQLIARRVRELGVYSELIPFNTPIEKIKRKGAKGIIFSGGPASVYEENAPIIDEEIYNLGIPVLGICYGMQLMAHQFKSKVTKAFVREYGKAEIEVSSTGKLFNGLPTKQEVLMSHSDLILTVPDGFEVNAKTKTTPVAAMSNEEKQLYAVQFHPEVKHTKYGMEIIENFIFSICKAKADWSMENFIEEKVAEIKNIVGDKRVLVALSGGVDSAVTAAIINKAIGKQLTCMFVDHGLLRRGEAESVMSTFSNRFNMDIVKIDARERFLNKLKEVKDPEAKRKIIGNEFIRVFEEEAKNLGEFQFLAQGTLYTDIIESGTTTAQTIKSHHNVGGLPANFAFDLIEPLKSLFKDEVRIVGEKLGLPKEIVWRQPFPGPGLAIRILGEVTEEKLHLVRESDAILREEIAKTNLEGEIWQYFTVLLDVKSVGVMGDVRTYAYPIVIRAVTSIDGMTADWARIPYEVLEKISNRIVNEIPNINRVVLDITSKPPATIEWE